MKKGKGHSTREVHSARCQILPPGSLEFCSAAAACVDGGRLWYLTHTLAERAFWKIVGKGSLRARSQRAKGLASLIRAPQLW